MATPNDGGRIPFPYGPLYAVPASLTVLGLILYHIAAFSCGTFYESYTEYRLGYFRAEYIYGGCGNFKDGIEGYGYVFSGTWKFGRFIAVVGALLVWALFFAVGAATFVKYPHPEKRYILVIAIGMGVVAFFSLLLLVGLSEGYSLGGAGAMAILSAFVWTGASVSMFYCMKGRQAPPPSATASSEIPVMVTEKPSTTNLVEESNNSSMNDGVPVVPMAPIYSNSQTGWKYEDPERQVQQKPMVSDSTGEWNAADDEDEVIGNDGAPSILLYEEKVHRVEEKVHEEEVYVEQGEPEIQLCHVDEFVDQGEPEIQLYDEDEEDRQVNLSQTEPEGKSVIKMDYEAEIPPKQRGKSGKGPRPLEP